MPRVAGGFPSRRDVLTGATALAIGALGVQAVQAKESRRTKSSALDPTKLKAVIDAATQCQKAGEHSLALAGKHLGQGNTKMSGCQESCTNMLAVTKAMLTVAVHATANPQTIRDLAAVTAKVTRVCEAVCMEFTNPIYRACGGTCRNTATACEALAKS